MKEGLFRRASHPYHQRAQSKVITVISGLVRDPNASRLPLGTAHLK